MGKKMGKIQWLLWLTSGVSDNSTWAIFGKQNWQGGMNLTSGKGAQVLAHQIPRRVLVHCNSLVGGHAS